MKFVAMRKLLIILMFFSGVSCTQVSDFSVADRSKSICAVAETCLSAARTFVAFLPSSCEEGELNDEVQKPVTKQLKYKNQEGVVEVVMKVDEKGNWKVVNMAATNEELAKYVLTKLKDYNQVSHKAVGQVVKYRFVFKKQV